MGLVLKLQTPEANYFLDLSRDCHFAIDCACGGKSGSHYKNATEDLETTTSGYEPLNPKTKLEHTFYVAEWFLPLHLEFDHSERKGKQPLIIVCNDCNKEFSFTHESYHTLREKIHQEGTRVDPPQITDIE